MPLIKNLLQKLCIPILLLILIAPPTIASASTQQTIASYPLLPSGYHSIRVFDNQGRFAGRILPEKRYWTPLERIPSFLQKAVVAVEDARFYEHSGIDVRGIARAAVKNVVKGRMAEGGSTITQQLIKNKYLSSEKTLDRKINEGFMAIELEKKYTKKQILEMYLNEIYFGNGAWGIAQAARLYFDKSPEELSEAECAILAGVPKNPGRYNPLGKPLDVGMRRDVVLSRMVASNMITDSYRKKLRNQPVAAIQPNQALYYISLVRNRLVERFGSAILELGGLEITSAMDLNLQKQAEESLKEGVSKISPELQGALVSIDPQTGNILAAVGGTDPVRSQFNRAITAKRQPGSSIKPLIYAYAIENGARSEDIWNDQPITYNQGSAEPWQPLNYDGKSHGDLSLRQALTHSNNVIAVKLLDTMGVPGFADFANRVGLPLQNRNDLTQALGTEEVTLHDLVFAYAPFANNGNRAEPRSIIRIYDTYRKSWTENPAVSNQVITPGTSFITTLMLKDVMTHGTAKNLKSFSQTHPSAGKTGTTNDYRDAWFIGYTPQMVTGVWIGYDRPRPGGKGFTGGTVAAPIWGNFMKKALQGKPVADFKKPDDVVSRIIDPSSGQLANSSCPKRQEAFYIKGTEPELNCQRHAAPTAPAPSP